VSGPAVVLRLAANGLWGLLCLPDALRFRRAISSAEGVRAAQEGLLLSLLRQNRDTAYGRRQDFGSIRTVADYQRRVPLTEYEDLAPAVERIGLGHQGELTAERVRLLEPTSGSSAPTKHIPYTASLKREFRRAIAPWIVDLFRRDPGLLAGQAYWSVTPIARAHARTPGGIPIGFEEDGEYLSPLQRRLVGATMAVPPEVKGLQDMETFRYVTLLFLLRSPALALVSVWSPTFLTLLVEPLAEWWPRLAEDVERGVISGPPAPRQAGESPAPPGRDGQNRAVLRRLEAHCTPDPGRAAEVRRICAGARWAQGTGAAGAVHRRLWPRLRVISCWADAQAGPYAAQALRLFPQARLQPKGLIATEGIVSLPLAPPGPLDSTGPPGPPGLPGPGAVLAVRSHFFEFIPEAALPAAPQAAPQGCSLGAGEEGRSERTPLLAHQLEVGGRYEVVLTTSGGLYRYRLHDLVEVTGHAAPAGGCPLLRFVGREGHVSDWFGEKLDERHVHAALEQVLSGVSAGGVRPDFAMLACERPDPAAHHQGSPRDERGATGPAYTLFVQAPGAADSALVAAGAALERALLESYHYRYCRDLGQLGPLRVFRIARQAQQAYLAECQRRGMRPGDVKPAALHRLDGWSRAFSGRFLAPPGFPSAG
jgi:hypothetical protein